MTNWALHSKVIGLQYGMLSRGAPRASVIHRSVHCSRVVATYIISEEISLDYAISSTTLDLYEVHYENFRCIDS